MDAVSNLDWPEHVRQIIKAAEYHSVHVPINCGDASSYISSNSCRLCEQRYYLEGEESLGSAHSSVIPELVQLLKL